MLNPASGAHACIVSRDKAPYCAITSAIEEATFTERLAVRYDEWQLDDEDDELEYGQPRRGRRSANRPRPRKVEQVADEGEIEDEWETDHERRERERRRADISEPFKCRNCRAFIGEPPSGGRQRNHCPMCLYSLHVDLKTPGDRASDCRSLMEPIGTFYRPSLEQVVVHRCLGCGAIRYNRVAADDNPILLEELPVLDEASLPDRDDGVK